MRYRTCSPSKDSLVYMTYRKIALITGIHTNKLVYVCRKAIHSNMDERRQTRM